MKKIILILITLFCLYIAGYSQDLSVQWEYLFEPQFEEAIEQSGGVCIIAMGVLEKHGPHMAVGTDALVVHNLCVQAAQKEYAVGFPFYYVGQIFEAKHQPGTIAYSPELIYKMLDETCREIARNGFKKIILFNGHGGSTAFIQFFCQTQLESLRDYVVYEARPSTPEHILRLIKEKQVSTHGGHADELEASSLMAMYPELVKPELASVESGEPKGRLSLFQMRPGIFWYADYPNHYAGEASNANPELGKIDNDATVELIVQMIRSAKTDNVSIPLQNDFYRRAANPKVEVH